MSYRCRGCGRGFATGRGLGGHRSEGCGRTDVSDEYVTAAEAIREEAAAAAQPITAEVVTVSDAEPSASFDADDADAEPQLELHQLLQRPCVGSAKHGITDTILRPASQASPEFDPDNTFKLDTV